MEEDIFLNKTLEEEGNTAETKQLQKKYLRGWVEVIRRISGAFSVFTLTLLGCAFGIHIGRNKENSKGIALVILLSTLTLFLISSQRDLNIALKQLLHSTLFRKSLLEPLPYSLSGEPPG